MIRCTHFVPPVLRLPDTTDPSREDSITPRRRSPLLARVIIVCSDVVLVRWRKGDRTLGKGSESEAWVPLPGQQKLIPFQEFAQVIRLDCVDDGVSGHGVDTIVEIPVEYTYLMIEDQGAIASANIHVSSKRCISLCRQRSGFENGGNISVAVHCLSLAGSQVAVDETDRAVIENEA